MLPSGSSQVSDTETAPSIQHIDKMIKVLTKEDYYLGITMYVENQRKLGARKAS